VRGELRSREFHEHRDASGQYATAIWPDGVLVLLCKFDPWCHEEERIQI
jgi:hypothetical protein